MPFIHASHHLIAQADITQKKQHQEKQKKKKKKKKPKYYPQETRLPPGRAQHTYQI
jgi:hypothetical protein